MEKIINTIIFIIAFIGMLLIPQYVFAKTFEVTFVWEHSGRGQEKFVFVPSPINVGPWVGEPHPVLISELTSTEVDGNTRWETTIVVEIDSFENMAWWVCYAESPWGSKSNISEPAKSVLKPNQPHSLKKLSGDVSKNKFIVHFI